MLRFFVFIGLDNVTVIIGIAKYDVLFQGIKKILDLIIARGITAKHCLEKKKNQNNLSLWIEILLKSSSTDIGSL